MLSPSELSVVARLLAADPAATDAHLRRAISTACYALFHTVTGAAAERFIGEGASASVAFALLSRGFDHKPVKSVCLAINVSTLKRKYAGVLGRDAVGQELQSSAGTFALLQEARHRADYDPTADFLSSNVTVLVDLAEGATEAFGRANAAERTDVLALMLVGARD